MPDMFLPRTRSHINLWFVLCSGYDSDKAESCLLSLALAHRVEDKHVGGLCTLHDTEGRD